MRAFVRRGFESSLTWPSLVLFIVFALLVRSGTFLVSSMDWDEGLYIVGAESVLRGNLPYIEVWDHKPPGIFFVFAGAIALVGDPVLAVRLLACVAVGVTAYSLARLLSPERTTTLAGICAGVLYVVFSLGNDGMSANTEIFYMTFVMLALVVVMSSARIDAQRLDSWPSWSRAAFSGLLLGVAGAINYLALLYSIAIAAVVLLIPLATHNCGADVRVVLFRQSLKLGVVGLGPIVVFAVIILMYGLAGSLDHFVYANVTSNRQYLTAQPYDMTSLAVAVANQFSAQWFLWLCALLSPVVVRATGSLSVVESRALLIVVGCLIAGAIGVSTSRLYWAHYFLQWNAALCLMAGLVLGRLIAPLWMRSAALAGCVLLMLSLGAFHGLFKDHAKAAAAIILHRYVHGQAYWGDHPAQVSEYIRARIRSGDYIYVVDCSPIIYSKAGAALPTRFVFPPFLIGKESSLLLDADAHQELRRILALEPEYIVRKRERPDPAGTLDSYYAQLDLSLQRQYTLEHGVAGIDLYRRTK